MGAGNVILFDDMPMSVDIADMHTFASSLLSNGKQGGQLSLGKPLNHVLTQKDNQAVFEYENIPIVENNRVIGHLQGPVSFHFEAQQVGDKTMYTLQRVETANDLIPSLLPSLQAKPEVTDQALRQAITYQLSISDLTRTTLPLDHPNFELQKYRAMDFTLTSDSGNGSRILAGDLRRELTANGVPIRVAGKASSDMSNEEIFGEFQKTTQLSNEDMAHLTQAYTQAPAQLVPAVVKLSQENFTDDSVSLMIDQPGNGPENGNRQSALSVKNGEIYYQMRFDRLPVKDKHSEDELNNGQPKTVGYIPGPAEANFKLVQTTPEGKWAFQLENIKTNNPFIVDAMRGKMHNEADIRQQISPSAPAQQNAPQKVEPKKVDLRMKMRNLFTTFKGPGSHKKPLDAQQQQINKENAKENQAASEVTKPRTPFK